MTADSKKRVIYGESNYKNMVLSLDFSVIDPSGSIEDIRSRFNQHDNIKLQSVTRRYHKYFGKDVDIGRDTDVSINLESILILINDYNFPRL